MQAKPIGILGGTFDPIHFGHLRLAEEGRQYLDLAQVRLMPAGLPSHRNAPQAQAPHRLRMVELATTGNPALSIDASEIFSTQASYTVPSLRRLRAELGEAQALVLLLGADAFAGLTQWQQWESLFELAHLGVATRPGHPLQALHWPPALAKQWAQRIAEPSALHKAAAGSIVPFPIAALDISATAIRAALQRGASPRYLLPEAVLDYIAQHRLYTAPAPAAGR